MYGICYHTHVKKLGFYLSNVGHGHIFQMLELQKIYSI